MHTKLASFHRCAAQSTLSRSRGYTIKIIEMWHRAGFQALMLMFFLVLISQSRFQYVTNDFCLIQLTLWAANHQQTQISRIRFHPIPAEWDLVCHKVPSSSKAYSSLHILGSRIVSMRFCLLPEICIRLDHFLEANTTSNLSLERTQILVFPMCLMQLSEIDTTTRLPYLLQLLRMTSTHCSSSSSGNALCKHR